MAGWPVDARDVPLNVGDFVAYATKDRDSVLQFGTIFKIKEKVDERPVYDPDTRKYTGTEPYTTYKIQMLKTTPQGQPVFDTVWDRSAPNPENVKWGGDGFGKHVLTDNQSKSGFVEYSASKFLRV